MTSFCSPGTLFYSPVGRVGSHEMVRQRARSTIGSASGSLPTGVQNDAFLEMQHGIRYKRGMHLPGMVLEAIICITDVRTCLDYASGYVYRPIMADLVCDLELQYPTLNRQKEKFMAPIPRSLNIPNSPLTSQNGSPVIRHGTGVS